MKQIDEKKHTELKSNPQYWKWSFYNKGEFLKSDKKLCQSHNINGPWHFLSSVSSMHP